jgi:hypothetical protein
MTAHCAPSRPSNSEPDLTRGPSHWVESMRRESCSPRLAWLTCLDAYLVFALACGGRVTADSVPAGADAGTLATPSTSVPNAGDAAAGADASATVPQCAPGIVSGSTCGDLDPQACLVSCGPERIGARQLICSYLHYGGTSVGCVFPADRNYACYRVPADWDSQDPNCPQTEVEMPRHGEVCSVPPCVVCMGFRSASQALIYQGYCVCSADRVWSCATHGSWPCPTMPGCD